MIKKIFIINGVGGTGKDTFIEYLQKLIPTPYYILNISTVDKVKDAGYILGWTGAKTDEDRAFLSDLKLLADKYYNHSFNYIVSTVNNVQSNTYIHSIFIHCREPENIAILKERLNATTILIRNPNVRRINSNMADSNVENYKYDHIIDNDGSLYDLKNKAKMFYLYSVKYDIVY
jgi:guanylate kinase